MIYKNNVTRQKMETLVEWAGEIFDATYEGELFSTKDLIGKCPSLSGYVPKVQAEVLSAACRQLCKESCAENRLLRKSANKFIWDDGEGVQ